MSLVATAALMAPATASAAAESVPSRADRPHRVSVWTFDDPGDFARSGPEVTVGSVELTRLIKLNLDNRPLQAALLEIRRLLSAATTVG